MPGRNEGLSTALGVCFSAMIDDDPEYWRRRAKETRTMAELTGDPEARRIMLNLAATYEALAKLAEGHIAAAKPSNDVS